VFTTYVRVVEKSPPPERGKVVFMAVDEKLSQQWKHQCRMKFGSVLTVILEPAERIREPGVVAVRTHDVVISSTSQSSRICTLQSLLLRDVKSCGVSMSSYT